MEDKQQEEGVKPPSSSAGQGLPFWDDVAVVGTDDVFRWLLAGWRDLRKGRFVSLAYGLVFVVIGFCLTGGLYLLDMLYLVSPMIGGFLLVGPLLAMAFYDISRRFEAGEQVRFFEVLLAWRRNPYHIMTAGLVLMLVMMIWVRLSVILYAIFFPYTRIDMAGLWQSMLTPEGVGFAITSSILGGSVAVLVYVSCAVALPLMCDRRIDFFKAAAVSIICVVKNLKAMVLWAAIVALFTFGGLLSGYIGLIITLPLIGHASWHAYRTLVPKGIEP